VWHATYRLDGAVKAITALLSVATAALLAPLLPALVHLPNPMQLVSMNQKLEAQTQELERKAEDMRRHAELLDLAYDAILVRELDGTIRFWNRGAENLYGWSREEALGRATHELLKTQFPDTVESVLEHVEHRNHWTGELTHTTRDGNTVVVLSRWTSRRTDDGRTEILEVNSDVTERKRIEETLEEKNIKLEQASRRFQALVESAPDGIIIANGNGEIVFINSQTELLFGYPRAELLGRPIEVLLPERFREMHPSHRAGYVGRPRSRPMGAGLELFGLRRDGREFPVEISLSPIETEEGLLVISSVRDATKRKQFERTLREKNVELEKANSAKDVFLSSLSHELRTPLNAIIGYTGTLLMRLPGQLTTEQERQLKSIQAGGRHLLSLINDLLDLAKIESGKVHVQLVTTECRDIVAEVASALTPMADARKLKFEYIVPNGSLLVRTDRRALSQILLNLVGNAIKFTTEGAVRVEVKDRPLNGDLMAAIDVTDTGVGIKAEDLPRLFKPFDRLHDALRVEGTGLGLHLCHKLAELIEAKIEVESEHGKGSRFTLLVPRSR
jgi:protein-histidine pros-kinase